MPFGWIDEVIPYLVAIFRYILFFRLRERERERDGELDILR